MSFEQADHWKKHYTASRYYPLWAIIADRLRPNCPQRVLDIGCGPGQVAELLRDIGISDYLGIDFSKARIEAARKVCPEFEFLCADIFNDKVLEESNYDCVLAMEFLEHVENDVEVLNRTRPGTTILATVPNFPSRGHVRYFSSNEEVKERYRSVMKQLDVVSVLANNRGKRYYLMQGIR